MIFLILWRGWSKFSEFQLFFLSPLKFKTFLCFHRTFNDPPLRIKNDRPLIIKLFLATPGADGTNVIRLTTMNSTTNCCDIGHQIPAVYYLSDGRVKVCSTAISSQGIMMYSSSPDKRRRWGEREGGAGVFAIIERFL